MKSSIILFLMSINITPQLVYQELIKQEVECPKVVLRQSILETGWYTSNVFKNYNNLFGMTYYDGSKRQYRKYKSWKESIKSYKNWQDQYYSGGNYYDFLECVYKNKKGECKRYATSPTYVNKLKNIKIDV